MYTITSPVPGDGTAITALLDRAFGMDRARRISYRLRDGTPAIPALSRIARDASGRVVGSIAYTPVAIGPAGDEALLLGPLAVDPTLRGHGIGRTLVGATLALARALGHRRVVLVGDPAYYRPLGFEAASRFGITVGGESPDRVQAMALEPDAFETVTGAVHRIDDFPSPARQATEACG